MSKFDDLCFVPKSILDIPKAPLDVTTRIAVVNSEREVTLQLPLIFRQIGFDQLGEDWEEFCAICRRSGIALNCPASSLEAIPAAAIPVRMSQRYLNEPFDPVEVSTADMIEIVFGSSGVSAWTFPEEVGDISHLADFVVSLREAAAGNTPVGIALPIGIRSSDLEELRDSQIDFITLCADPAVLRSPAQTLASVGQVGRFAKALKIPLIVDTPLKGVRSAICLLALGASVVCADSLVSKAIRVEEAEDPGGMLSSLGVLASNQKSKVIEATESVVRRIEESLVAQMHFCGTMTLEEFDDSVLRATSRDAACLTSLPMAEV